MILPAILALGKSILDKVIEDPKQKADAQLALILAAEDGHLKEAQQEFLSKQLESEEKLKLSELQLENLKSARQTNINDRTISHILAITITVGFFTACFLNRVIEIPPDFTTTLRDGWLVIVAYYFGSSLGSGQKSDAIHGIIKQQPTKWTDPDGAN